MAQQFRLNVTPEKAGSLLASLLARRGARIVSRDGGTITVGTNGGPLAGMTIAVPKGGMSPWRSAWMFPQIQRRRWVTRSCQVKGDVSWTYSQRKPQLSPTSTAF